MASLELGELDDLVEAAATSCALQPEERAVEVDVLAAGQLGVDAGADLDERADPAHVDRRPRSGT